jgi:hypothetical protein
MRRPVDLFDGIQFFERKRDVIGRRRTALHEIRQPAVGHDALIVFEAGFHDRHDLASVRRPHDRLRVARLMGLPDRRALARVAAREDVGPADDILEY